LARIRSCDETNASEIRRTLVGNGDVRTLFLVSRWKKPVKTSVVQFKNPSSEQEITYDNGDTSIRVERACVASLSAGHVRLNAFEHDNCDDTRRADRTPRRFGITILFCSFVFVTIIFLRPVHNRHRNRNCRVYTLKRYDRRSSLYCTVY